MHPTRPNKGHVVHRPHSSGSPLSKYVNGPAPKKLARHRRRMVITHPWKPTQTENGDVVLASVKNLCFGVPNEYPVKQELLFKNDRKIDYTASFSKYIKQSDTGPETRYEINIYENEYSNNSPERRSTKLVAFRFGTATKLEVRLLREVREIQLFKFRPNLLKDIANDKFWTFNLVSNVAKTLRQGYAFWAALRQNLEEMPLSHLAYANVQRRLVGPAPLSNLHGMQNQSQVTSDLGEHHVHIGQDGGVLSTSAAKSQAVRPFLLPVPNARGQDWAFPGHLSHQSFKTAFDKVSIHPTEKKDKAGGRKVKKRQAKKRAAAEEGREAKRQRRS